MTAARADLLAAEEEARSTVAPRGRCGPVRGAKTPRTRVSRWPRRATRPPRRATTTLRWPPRATLAIATAEAVPWWTRVDGNRRATAAAAEAYLGSWRRGAWAGGLGAAGGARGAAAARDRTPAVYKSRWVERLLAEGMRAKERYDSLVASGVRGAAAQRAFGVMCRALRKTEKGRRRLAACMDAAAARASPRQLESEFRRR